MSTPERREAAARRVLQAQASGTTPSLVDHLILGTVGDLEVDEPEGLPGQPEEDGEIIAVEPTTTRPQPAPEPPPPPPIVVAPPGQPVDQVPLSPTEQALAVRASLMNPGMSQDKIRRVVRRATAYLR